MKQRIQKIGSSNNQTSENIIIEGNSLFQKGSEKKYSKDYISGYTLRSTGDLDNNKIYIKASNIQIVNIGDIIISKDKNTDRLLDVNNIERFRDDVEYYIYGENIDKIKAYAIYKDGQEDYYAITNIMKLRNLSQYPLARIRLYCDKQYYGDNLSASAKNIYFRDVTTKEDNNNTDLITISLDSTLKRVGDIYDYINLTEETITRRIGQRKYTDGDENDEDVLTDYNITLYKLENYVKYKIKITKKELNLLSGGYLILENNIIPSIKVSYKSKGIKDDEVYNNPLLKGAVGDGIEDDSQFIMNDWNYIPEGYTFRVDKVTSLILHNSHTFGEGNIIVKDFPYDPRKNQLQGIVNASNIKDGVKIAMNLPNDETPNGVQMRQRIGGVLSFEDAKIAKDYKVINAWGQVYLIAGEKYPENAIVHISNLTVLGYRESTKNWEILNNPDNIYGKFYYEDYHNQSYLNANDRINNHVYSAVINSSYSGRVLHLWSKQHYIEELDKDFKYMCAYMDAWVTGDDISSTNDDVVNKFVMNVGSDLRKNYDTDVRELCSGRYVTLTNYPKRCYATNLNAQIINQYCSQELIDSIRYSAAKYYGRSFDRPIAPMKGEYYFDYELNKVIYWNGSNWCDSLGKSL
jgi:hypothetical protein